MKPAQLEILLFTGTRFSSKRLIDKYYTGNQNNFPGYNPLAEACWNGLFREMLPELYGKDLTRKKMVLWNVVQGEHFLELEYGEQPQPLDKIFSVNPYFFMGMQLLS